MCGIFGWIAPSGVENASLCVNNVLESIQRRGPDDRGIIFRRDTENWSTHEQVLHKDVSKLMGHVRLSILDLTSRGHQPVISEDRRYQMVYNGEVYNYRELRSELQADGICFYSDMDTEVVFQALIRWGLECLNKFTGMFAIAWHDDKEKRLYLIRDHFGIKPLYYAYGQHKAFFFASDIPSLLQFPITRRVNAQRVYDYLLFGDYDSQQETMLEGVYHIQQAHYMILNSDTAEIVEEQRYWKPDLTRTSSLSFLEASDQFREMFLDSIRLHLRSDVKLGTALSGGLDSSAITAAVRYLEPDMDLPTFTFVAEGSAVNEEGWADLLGQSVTADMYKLSVSSSEMASDIDHVIRAQGEPFGGTSIYAQYRIFKLVRDAGVKVTLDGQGADELLAGYFGFPGQRLKSLLSQGRILAAWNFFQATSRWPGRSQIEVFKRLVGVMAPVALYPWLYTLGMGSLKPSWLDQDWCVDHRIRQNLPRVENIYCGRNYVRRELATQLTQRGLSMLLRHGDRNSMCFSVESRVPFLTRELAEFVFTLPEEYLIASDGTSKSLLRNAMRGIVPNQILERRDKVGFATPERDWLHALEPWVERVLRDSDDIPVFNRGILRKSWQEVLHGQRPFDFQVWRWLNFIRWAKIYDVQFD